jgi:opacity protein-like surface antigen
MRSLVSEFGDNLFGGVGDPDIVDENGHYDQLQARQPGVHVAWTGKVMDGDLIVGVGVEKAGSDLQTRTGLTAFKPASGTSTTGTPTTATVDEGQGNGEDVPMFGAAARYRTPLWAVFVRGAVQKHKAVFTVPAANNTQDTALTGWLGAISAEVTPGPARIFAQYWFGDGLNRAGGSFADAAVVAGGFVGQSGLGPQQSIRHIKAIETHNWHAGAEYKLTKDLKAEASYEFQNAVANRQIFDLQSTSADKRDFQAVHAGLIYSFWTRFDTGLEYVWGKVNSFGSSEGIMNQVNWRLRFYF